MFHFLLVIIATCFIFCEESGEVFCWGSNQYGQCGVGPSNGGKSFSSPVQVEGLLKKVKVAEIFSGWCHILAKTGNT